MHTTETLERAMQRALELAQFGPAVDVNPQVGCVVLDPSGAIVAEGWHQGSGTPHAEVAALNALRENSPEWLDRTAELTFVVTLEPCNHTGKTGPCAQALIDAGVGAVAYSLADHGARSAGGARRLHLAGVEVRSAIAAADTKRMLSDWLARKADAEQAAGLARARPYVTVKWAQTLDGRAAAADGTSQWITGALSRRDVHQRRAAADAILVGTQTVFDDDPSLTARDDDGALLVSQPIPVVMGSREVPVDAKVRQHPAVADQLITISGRSLEAELSKLLQQGIHSIFVEGGPTVISALLAADVVDEVIIYMAPKLLGGPRCALNEIGVSTLTEATELSVSEVTTLGDDVLVSATVQREQV